MQEILSNVVNATEIAPVCLKEPGSSLTQSSHLLHESCGWHNLFKIY
jgi:hypothetical protein